MKATCPSCFKETGTSTENDIQAEERILSICGCGAEIELQEHKHYLRINCLNSQCSQRVIVTLEAIRSYRTINCKCGFEVGMLEVVGRHLVTHMISKEMWAWDLFNDIYGCFIKRQAVRFLEKFTVPNREKIAEEVYQNICVDILVGDFDVRTSFMSLLTRVTHNCCFDACKKYLPRLKVTKKSLQQLKYFLEGLVAKGETINIEAVLEKLDGKEFFSNKGLLNAIRETITDEQAVKYGLLIFNCVERVNLLKKEEINANIPGENYEKKFHDRILMGKLLSKLSVEEKNLISYRVERYSYKEIEKHSGIPEKTVKRLLNRIKDKCRDILGIIPKSFTSSKGKQDTNDE